VIRDTREHVPEPGEGLDAGALARGREGHQHPPPPQAPAGKPPRSLPREVQLPRATATVVSRPC
jgi:hypothetical protein